MRGMMLAAAAMAFAQLANAETIDKSGWQVETTKSEMTGETTNSVARPSSNKLSNSIGVMTTATLAVYCGSKKPVSVIVIWPDIVDRDYVSNHADVSWKFDDGPIKSLTVFASTDAVILNGAAKPFIQQMLTAKRVIVKVPDQHGGQEAVFDLTTIDAVRDDIAACK